jgi:signal transduction histidine kinase
LATGIAHEINTPIQYINENLQYIQRGFMQIRLLIQKGEEYLNQVPAERKGDFLLPDELSSLKEVNQLLENRNTRHYLEEIPKAIQESLEGIERVRKIILAIREFSHPSDNEKKPSPINHAIQNVITISKNEWKNVAEIELELEPDLPLVFCRVDEINQALLNMVINAAQAIESNPARPNNQKGIIQIKTWHTSTDVYISIQDSGCGIEDNVIDRIFDPFFTTKDIGEGTGQGLFIAHTIIVKKHHGMISVKTEKNIGTIFTIQIPINNDPSGEMERKGKL